VVFDDPLLGLIGVLLSPESLHLASGQVVGAAVTRAVEFPASPGLPPHPGRGVLPEDVVPLALEGVMDRDVALGRLVVGPPGDKAPPFGTGGLRTELAPGLEQRGLRVWWIQVEVFSGELSDFGLRGDRQVFLGGWIFSGATLGAGSIVEQGWLVQWRSDLRISSSRE
jgi:hypothetical protein